MEFDIVDGESFLNAMSLGMGQHLVYQKNKGCSDRLNRICALITAVAIAVVDNDSTWARHGRELAQDLVDSVAEGEYNKQIPKDFVDFIKLCGMAAVKALDLEKDPKVKDKCTTVACAIMESHRILSKNQIDIDMINWLKQRLAALEAN